MPTAKKCEDGWIRCGKCNHKLGKMKGVWPKGQAMPALEIKCHSCKEINYILIGGHKMPRKD